MFGDISYWKCNHSGISIILNALSIHKARNRIIRNVLCSLYKEIYCLSYLSFSFSKEILAIIFQISPIEKIAR